MESNHIVECSVECPVSGGRQALECATRTIKALAHPLRLKILCVLSKQEVTVSDITDKVGTSHSNISQHLSILRDKGILDARKDANQVYYRVVDPRTLQLLEMMCDVY